MWYLLFLLLLLIQDSKAYTYTYRDYESMVQSMKALQILYPDLVVLTSVEREYGFLSQLKCGNAICEHWYMQVYNRRIGVNRNQLPQLFISGELHGDERVGPNAVFEYVLLLLQNKAHYEPSFQNTSAFNPFQSVSPMHFNPYLSSILDTREIVAMPMTNALGYYNKQRLEGYIDINRDFPFDFPDAQPPCLQGESSRALQTLFSNNMFLIAITYHGGMRSISYEWGDHYNQKIKAAAPDDMAMKHIASMINDYSGGLYPVGKTNDLVYPVNGGMEEWGYAASWFNQYNKVETVPKVCLRNTNVMITPWSNRCMVYLIETTDIKTPPAKDLGDNNHNLFMVSSEKEGWINPLIKQCITAVDILFPYSSITSINNQTFRWSIGGAFHVDSTQLFVFKASDVQSIYSDPIPQFIKEDDDYSQITWITSKLYHQLLTILSSLTPVYSSTVFSGDTPLRKKPKVSFLPGHVSNHLSFKVQRKLPPGEYICIVRSAVDRFMFKRPNAVNPDIDPQSHLVNMRMNPEWKYFDEKSKRLMEGREWVFSPPVFYSIPHPHLRKAHNAYTVLDVTESSWNVFLFYRLLLLIILSLLLISTIMCV